MSTKEIVVKVTSNTGTCKAGHKTGDIFKVTPADSGGLCGAAYHTIFPIVAALAWDGVLPLDNPDKIETCCPDVKNLVSFEIIRQDIAK
ncbi:DenG|uniref:TIGR04076 family protein n=1 Tax=Dendrosporobacter quercicolus TaxID=146817 RepID=A0A1G9P0B8_9FIRM|nr:TIGR04076 family protein [Dendrosporobacter quercicolus]NSL47502.1 DenG [Dendrosporobacter quercicolus DSM 1736]SDL92100.1 TIGR04076 family protein [Dendrosporobacter quercicolus]